MLIPIGAEATKRGLPKATLALIALNVLVFIVTAPINWMDDAAFERAARPLAVMEAELEAKYVGQGADPKTWWPSRFREPTAVEKLFWEDFAAGNVLPKDHPTHVLWREAVDGFEEARKDTLYWKIAYRSGDPGLVSLFLSMFLHGGFEHLLFNMLFLWAVGANTEDVWGRAWFLGLYFVGGVVATLVQVIADPSPEVLQIGASGAIASIMGAFMVRHFRTRIRYFSIMPIGVFKLPAGIMLALWFAGELVAMFSAGSRSSGVAFGAHVGGFALGMGLALLLKLERIEEKVIAPELKVADRARHDAELHARVAVLEEKGLHRRIIEEYVKAIAQDPERLDLRRQHFELVRNAAPAMAKPDGEYILRELWRTGDRASFLELFPVVDTLTEEPLGPALTFRAAQAMEATDPHRAAQLLHRAAQGDAADPMATKALERYADLLERLGAPDSAAKARAILESRRKAGT